jgi:hypothetical protein
MLQLRALVCGNNTAGHGPLGDVLSHLGQNLDSVISEFPLPIGNSQGLSSLFVPFLVRSAIDVAMTALLARVDPFRVLALRSVQAGTDYDSAAKNESAIRWYGDIISADPPPQNPWSTMHRPEKMTRALLGDYQAAVLWQPAFNAAIDYLSTRTFHGPWTREIRTIDPDSFLPRYKRIAIQTFSRASKGVHHEFVIPPKSYYTKADLTALTGDAIKLCGCLGMLLSFSEHAKRGLPVDQVVDAFEALQTVDIGEVKW